MISLQADDVGKSNPGCCCGGVVVRRRAALAQTSVYLVLSACSLLPLHIISFLHLLTVYYNLCWLLEVPSPIPTQVAATTAHRMQAIDGQRTTNLGHSSRK
jgi:hypothetical protein